jgi:hypothetical protein
MAAIAKSMLISSLDKSDLPSQISGENLGRVATKKHVGLDLG